MATTPSSPPTAAERVFGIFELLEKILLDVVATNADLSNNRYAKLYRTFNIATNKKTLSKCRRVGTTFKATIEKSSKLQQVLTSKPPDRPYYPYIRRADRIAAGTSSFANIKIQAPPTSQSAAQRLLDNSHLLERILLTVIAIKPSCKASHQGYSEKYFRLSDLQEVSKTLLACRDASAAFKQIMQSSPHFLEALQFNAPSWREEKEGGIVLRDTGVYDRFDYDDRSSPFWKIWSRVIEWKVCGC